MKFDRKDELGERGRRGGANFLVSMTEIAFMRVPLVYGGMQWRLSCCCLGRYVDGCTDRGKRAVR